MWWLMVEFMIQDRKRDINEYYIIFITTLKGRHHYWLSFLAFGSAVSDWRVSFSSKSERSHFISSSSSFTRDSRRSDFSVISCAVRSKACSRCFFLIRNRALAAVLRRRLSSSAPVRSPLWFGACSLIGVLGVEFAGELVALSLEMLMLSCL